MDLDTEDVAAGEDAHEELAAGRCMTQGVGGEFGNAESDVVGDPGLDLGPEQPHDELPRPGHRPGPPREPPFARRDFAERIRRPVPKGDRATVIEACAPCSER